MSLVRSKVKARKLHPKILAWHPASSGVAVEGPPSTTRYLCRANHSEAGAQTGSSQWLAVAASPPSGPPFPFPWSLHGNCPSALAGLAGVRVAGESEVQHQNFPCSCKTITELFLPPPPPIHRALPLSSVLNRPPDLPCGFLGIETIRLLNPPTFHQSAYTPNRNNGYGEHHLPQVPRRFRQHHVPDRAQAPQARLPVQCHLRR